MALDRISQKRLEKVHWKLKRVCVAVDRRAVYDRSLIYRITWGFRRKADQDRAFRKKVSRVSWPGSDHNRRVYRLVKTKWRLIPESVAVDVVPKPIDWGDTDRFCFLIGAFKAESARLGIKLKYGYDIILPGGGRDYGHIALHESEYEEE